MQISAPKSVTKPTYFLSHFLLSLGKKTTKNSAKRSFLPLASRVFGGQI
jgi:hypothetical protein